MRALFVLTVLAVRTTIQVDGLADEVLPYFYRCRTRSLDECLERDFVRTVDGIMKKHETYRINRYFTVTVNGSADGSGARSNGAFGTRLLDFFNALHVQYEPENTDGPTEEVFEGRKKKKDKDKSKMSMMMAAAAMGMSAVNGMAMKMMMGGVMMIALKALILAKIALALAAIIALKKLMGSGGGSPQPVWASSSVGGTEHAGYRRSYDIDHGMSSVGAQMAYRDQIGGYNDVQSQYS